MTEGHDDMDFKRYHRINSKRMMRFSPALTEFLKADIVWGWLSSNDEGPVYIALVMNEALTDPAGQNENVEEIPVEEGAMLLPPKLKKRLGRRAILVKRGSLLEAWPFTKWMSMPEVLTNEIHKKGEIVEGPEKPDYGEEVNRLETEIAELTAERDRISSEIMKRYEMISKLIDW